jgi:hypothetical protein
VANTWNDFVQFVAHSCPGCSTLTIQAHIQAAMDEFCAATNIWTEELDPFGVLAGMNQYSIPVDNFTRVLGVESVRYNGLLLRPMTPRLMDRSFPLWGEITGENQVQAYWVELDDDDQLLTFWPTPVMSVPASVIMRVSLKPTASATSVPGFFFDDWRTVIGSGALEQILMIPNKDWTNPQMATMHGAKFRTGKARAKARAIGMQSGATLTIHSQRFGG